MSEAPKSRPKCPACFGGGEVPHPLDEHIWLECSHCHGQRHDPYYTGEKHEHDSSDGR